MCKTRTFVHCIESL